MDSNAFLLSFGMKPEDFDRTEGPIQSDEGFVYEGWEAGNDVAQTMIDAAYGYHNFERFRKRFLPMRWNKKK